MRGWSPDAVIHDDPEEGDEIALTVRFTVDSTLEPRWSIYKDAAPEGKPIYSSDRAKFKVFRVDDQSDQHLGWGRGSALATLTSNLDDLPRTLASAHRSARAAFSESAPSKLTEAATTAHSEAIGLGVRSQTVFAPAIHPAAMSHRSALVLSSGVIPTTALGLGSRRLTALAIQMAQVEAGSVVIIDEVEHALEPHRLRYLLDRLEQAVAPTGDAGATGPPLGQVFLSTHSPISIEELGVGSIHVVHAKNSCVEITRAHDALTRQGDVDPAAIARVGAEALLGKRIVVCEGKTEIGFIRELGRDWSGRHQIPLAQLGVVPMLGGGETNAPKRARAMANLGYTTALLMDSDGVSPDQLTGTSTQGVRIVQWADQCAIEERIALDLPESGFNELVQLVAGIVGQVIAENAIPDMMANNLPENVTKPSGLDPAHWFSTCDVEPATLRRAFGRTAHKKKCFKTISGGEQLGRLVTSHLEEMTDTDTYAKIGILKSFCCANSNQRL